MSKLIAQLDEWAKTPHELIDYDGSNNPIYTPTAEVCAAVKAYLEKKPFIQWNSITLDGDDGIDIESENVNDSFCCLNFQKDGKLRFVEFCSGKCLLILEGKWIA